MHMWSFRLQAYRAVGRGKSFWRLLTWEIIRVVIFALGFASGFFAHDAFVAADNPHVARFVIGTVTFGTFLASFVLSVMGSTGGRQLTAMPDSAAVRRMKERLLWLLSEQMIMVASALLTAVSGLLWLGLSASTIAVPSYISGAVLAFAALTAVNAFRLPLQIWELQASALDEEQQRAQAQVNQKVEGLF